MKFKARILSQICIFVKFLKLFSQLLYLLFCPFAVNIFFNLLSIWGEWKLFNGLYWSTVNQSDLEWPTITTSWTSVAYNDLQCRLLTHCVAHDVPLLTRSVLQWPSADLKCLSTTWMEIEFPSANPHPPKWFWVSSYPSICTLSGPSLAHTDSKSTWATLDRPSAYLLLPKSAPGWPNIRPRRPWQF